jgi:hypothetical protein
MGYSSLKYEIKCLLQDVNTFSVGQLKGGEYNDSRDVDKGYYIP